MSDSQVKFLEFAGVATVRFGRGMPAQGRARRPLPAWGRIKGGSRGGIKKAWRGARVTVATLFTRDLKLESGDGKLQLRV